MALHQEQKTQQSTWQNGIKVKLESQTFNIFCDYKQKTVYQIIIFLIFLKLPVSGRERHNCIFIYMFPRCPWVASSCQHSSLHLNPLGVSTASSPITTNFSCGLFPILFLILLLLPYLPTSRFSNTSIKPKLLSPLVHCYDGSKEIRMKRKIIDLPYVGRLQNLDSTGFLSRLWEVVCYSN